MKKEATSKIHQSESKMEYDYLQIYSIHTHCDPVSECLSITMGCMQSKALYLLVKEGELFLDKVLLGKSNDSSNLC